LKQQLNCPICRNENIIQYYNNTIQLFNNRDSTEVNHVLVHNFDKYEVFQEVDDSSEEDDNNSSSSEPMEVDEAIILVNDISDQI
jgi:hypothetical protein